MESMVLGSRLADEVVTDNGLVAVVAVTETSPRKGKIGPEGGMLSAVIDRRVDNSPLGASLVVDTTELGAFCPPLPIVEPNDTKEEMDRRFPPESPSAYGELEAVLDRDTSIGMGREGDGGRAAGVGFGAGAGANSVTSLFDGALSETSAILLAPLPSRLSPVEVIEALSSTVFVFSSSSPFTGSIQG